MTEHYLTAQKAIDGLRLNFKSKKAKPVNRTGTYAINDNTPPCDCCGTASPQGGVTTIESNQKLCNACLKELRG